MANVSFAPEKTLLVLLTTLIGRAEGDLLDCRCWFLGERAILGLGEGAAMFCLLNANVSSSLGSPLSDDEDTALTPLIGRRGLMANESDRPKLSSVEWKIESDPLDDMCPCLRTATWSNEDSSRDVRQWSSMPESEESERSSTI